jgi:hypothetical protein
MKRNHPSKQATFIGCLCVASLGLFVLGLATPPTLLAAGQAKTVKDFGAVGDGKTDDHAAIQRAINAGIGEIRLPKGHYRITKPLRIDLDRAGYTSISGGGTATLIMAAGGPALHIIGTHNGTAAPGTVKANVWERQRLPLIEAADPQRGQRHHAYRTQPQRHHLGMSYLRQPRRGRLARQGQSASDQYHEFAYQL